MELRAAESYSPVRDNECSAACKADARCSSSLEVGDIWGDERVAVDWELRITHGGWTSLGLSWISIRVAAAKRRERATGEFDKHSEPHGQAYD